MKNLCVKLVYSQRHDRDVLSDLYLVALVAIHTVPSSLIILPYFELTKLISQRVDSYEYVEESTHHTAIDTLFKQSKTSKNMISVFQSFIVCNFKCLIRLTDLLQYFLINPIGKFSYPN